MSRISATDYAQIMEQARACVESLFWERGAPVPPIAVERVTGWGRGTARTRLVGAVERGLLRYHADLGAYSPAVDAEGRPVRLALVPDEEPQGESKSA